MSVVVLEPDPLKDIAELERRVRLLEQGRHGATYDSATGAPVFPAGVVIGSLFVADPLPAPTNLEVTWGSSFDRIFIDVEWDPPADPSQVATYSVELNKVGTGVVASQGGLGGTSARFDLVEPNTPYDVRVWAYNRLGQPSPALGPSAITTGSDSSLPAAVTGLVATAGFRTMVVRWVESAEQDVRDGHGGYELEYSTSDDVDEGGGFTVSPKASRTGATVAAIGDLVTDTQYFVHVRAIDSSGNFGPWSAIDTATPGQTVAGEYGALTIDDAAVANLSAVKVTFGVMSGDRIDVNTLDVNRLKSSSLDAQVVTIAGAGVLRIGQTAPPFNYLLQDASGLRFYAGGSAAFTGGTLITDLNVATGSASFDGPIVTGGSVTGTILRTAAGGERAEMAPLSGADVHALKTYADEGEGSAIASNVSGSGPGRYARTAFRSAHPDVANTRFPVVFLEGTSWDLSREVAIWLYTGEGDSYCYVSESSIDIKAGDGVRLLLDDSVGLSGGPLVLNDNILYIRSDGDANQRLYYDAGFNASVLNGWAATCVRSVFNDSGIVCNPAEVAIINFANTGHKPIRATAFNIASDRKFKRDIAAMRGASALHGSTRARQFRLRDDDETMLLGFVADEVPAAARRPGTLGDGYDLGAMVAILWETVHDMRRARNAESG